MDIEDLCPGFPVDAPENAHIMKFFAERDLRFMDILFKEPWEIYKIIRGSTITRPEFDRIRKDMVEAANGETTGTVKTGREAMEQQIEGYISFGDEAIDRLFGGGIPTQQLVEFVGEGGTGKTQILLQLLVTAQLPRKYGGLGRPCVYISTEESLNTDRLAQMINRYQSRYPDLQKPPSMDNIYTVTCKDFDKQEDIILNELPRLVERYKPGLVVIDSVAQNFRTTYVYQKSLPYNPYKPYKPNPNRSTFDERDQKILELAEQLRSLATEYDFAIVVANQVADRFSKGDMAKELLSWNSLKPSPKSKREIRDPGDRWCPSYSIDLNLYSGWPEKEDEWGMAKKPSLAWIWTREVGTRVVLRRRLVGQPYSAEAAVEEYIGDPSSAGAIFERSMGIVFSPFTCDQKEIRIEIYEGGVRGVQPN